MEPWDAMERVQAVCACNRRAEGEGAASGARLAKEDHGSRKRVWMVVVLYITVIALHAFFSPLCNANVTERGMQLLALEILRHHLRVGSTGVKTHGRGHDHGGVLGRQAGHRECGSEGRSSISCSLL